MRSWTEAWDYAFLLSCRERKKEKCSQLRAARGTAHDVGCLATQPCHQLTPFYQSRLTQTQLIALQAVGKCTTLTAALQIYTKTRRLLRQHIFRKRMKGEKKKSNYLENTVTSTTSSGNTKKLEFMERSWRLIHFLGFNLQLQIQTSNLPTSAVCPT